jgi:outer membrane protein assembly factor BamB
MRSFFLGLAVVVLVAMNGRERASAGDWPQFRGPGGASHVADNRKLPSELGPQTNVIWKCKLPPGHSSPILQGNRIFVTAVRDGKLFTIGLDRESGTVLWEIEAPREKLEEINSGTGSYAQPTPATDGERVVSFFGSCGLFCYDTSGKLLWQRPMGPFNNEFGAGSSPIIVGDRIILGQDHDTDSFLMALDKRTGETLWKTDRSEFPRNYCTPVIWDVAGQKQIVMAATLRVVGYDLETGRELWTVRGISRQVNMTPIVGDDGILYLAGWAAGGDKEEPIEVAPFDGLVEKYDANKNGVFEEDELPDGPIKMRFGQVDRDKSRTITKAEYEYMRLLFNTGKNLLLAIKPGGKGDVTDTHVVWQYPKFVPFCASPLYYGGRIFTVKDGGIVSCLEARTGKPRKQGRIAGTGDYYSSPVAGDGKVYLLNEEGQLTVISAADDWQELSTSQFSEQAYATPAIADGRIYLRTTGHLYCFGLPETAKSP